MDGDGLAYTRAAFVAEYGGVDEWLAAPSVEEVRIDPADGNKYDRASFVGEYGGVREWEAAKASSELRPKPKPPKPAPAAVEAAAAAVAESIAVVDLEDDAAAARRRRGGGRKGQEGEEAAAAAAAAAGGGGGGAILVFLPGMKEITTLHELLGAAAPFASAEAKAWLLPLHSTLGSDAQMKVFERPPKGVTKVVLATNIAETSVTIDDVTLVIDCGRHKQNEYDPRRRMEALVEGFASRANLTQRRGRAGASPPESRSTSSPRTASRSSRRSKRPSSTACHSSGSSSARCGSTPARAPPPSSRQLPQPPSTAAVKSAVKVLIGLGALEPLSPTPAGGAAAGGSCDDGGSSSSSAGGGGGGGLTERLTALGFHLASLPLDVRIGKLILLGAILQCVDPALTLAAALTCRSPFVAPFGMRAEADEAKKALAVGGSDHLTVVRAYSEWDALSGSARFKFAQEHFLSVKTLQMIAATKRELLEQLHDARFVSLPKGHRGGGGFGGGGGGADDGVRAAVGGAHHSRSTEVLLGLLVGAMWPRVARVDPPPPPRGGGRGRGAARGRGSGDGDGRGGGASGGGKIRVKDDCGVLTAALHPSCISARAGAPLGLLGVL